MIPLRRIVSSVLIIPHRGNSGGTSPVSRFWKWTTAARPEWKLDHKEKIVAFFVFGITGSTSVMLVRPILSDVFGLQGSMIEGPWSYRIGSILMVSPMYAVTLLLIGTLSGRHNFFAKMSFKILGRFFPKPLLHRVLCGPAKSKVQPPRV